MPTPFIAPLNPLEQEKPPAGADWIHEIKWDGYRVQVHLAGGKATVYTRGGHDWTRQFRPLAEAAARLPAKSAIIDGEAVVLSKAGVADYHALRGALDGRSTSLRLQAFDLLAIDGVDLRARPLLERKDRLQTLLAGAPPAVAYVEHMTGDGARILAHACQIGVEGIVSKRGQSPYRSGRSSSWIKVKCQRTAVLAVVGFTVERDAVAGLHLAWRTGGRLVYAGAVERGISRVIGLQLLQLLTPLVQARSTLVTKGVKAQWVRAEVSVEVTFPNTSEGGRLRHPKFVTLRERP